MPTLRPVCPAEVQTGQFGTINFAKESKGTITDGLVRCAACKPPWKLTSGHTGTHCVLCIVLNIRCPL